MKMLTIIGARPQFVKAGIVSKRIRELSDIDEILLHTGQHFDPNMSEIFFEQMGIPKPEIQLDIHGGSHGEMTGRMLIDIEKVIFDLKPDKVMVYGDTNSTLAGALAATKLHIPVVHVEAGLRSFNMRMPEEINRILTDQVSDILFCPTDTAMDNLRKEGFEQKNVSMLNVGDVMQDAALHFVPNAIKPYGVIDNSYFILATLHRAENTDDPTRLRNIVVALNTIHREIAPIVLPLHPRTLKKIKQNGLQLDVNMIEPVGYLEMLWLLKHCQLVLTDSGGVQKEAFFFSKYCVTMRDQTEWVELVEHNANTLVGADTKNIIAAVKNNIARVVRDSSQLYGGGNAAKNIVSFLSQL
ncbi:non-hydrolyzing UDP-N-acetylglucosamine 2-epimerase [Avibacterium avium]|uniref:non-hydrolyzing UDP-N-acetylglucosamine 2-epimerase n=1 Tax=Avibacterium avium TaxID=751 RepID=UPI003BF90922